MFITNKVPNRRNWSALKHIGSKSRFKGPGARLCIKLSVFSLLVCEPVKINSSAGRHLVTPVIELVCLNSASANSSSTIVRFRSLLVRRPALLSNGESITKRLVSNADLMRIKSRSCRTSSVNLVAGKLNQSLPLILRSDTDYYVNIDLGTLGLRYKPPRHVPKPESAPPDKEVVSSMIGNQNGRPEYQTVGATIFI
ncbi:hypothetical protein AGLY_006150 [Aphis glycines]|uniref:Uncharacterized protein n=1 Tax=Aphis glycines TaxID=307491 RepID=A0A6G0TSW8_APHGL|nr:hypothetical protein AGLY_006150 [Aphis glycines]